MNTQRTATRAAISFLALMAVLMAIAAGEQMGIIDSAGTKRAMGWVIGLMIIVMGNLLPKIRPLHALGWAAGEASRSERFAGWTLALAGIAYLALFTVAPLELARSISAVIALCAIAAIAVNWTWAARGAKHGTREAACPGTGDGRSAKKRRLVVGLMFAFLYVVGTACVVSLFDVGHWSNDAKTRMGVSILMVYGASFAMLNSRRRTK